MAYLVLFTARQRSGEGDVFSRVCPSVILSIGEGGLYRALGPALPRPPDMFKLVQLGPHCTGTWLIWCELCCIHLKTCNPSVTVMSVRRTRKVVVV